MNDKLQKRLDNLQAEREKFTREDAGLNAQLAEIRAGLPGLRAGAERGLIDDKEPGRAEQEIDKLERLLARKQAASRAVEHDIQAAQDDIYQEARQEYQRSVKELKAEALKAAERAEKALKEYLASNAELIDLWKRGIELQRAEAAAVNDTGFSDQGIGNSGYQGTFRNPEKAIALRADVITHGPDSLFALDFRPASMKEALFDRYEPPAIVPGRSIPFAPDVTRQQTEEIERRIAAGEQVKL